MRHHQPKGSIISGTAGRAGCFCWLPPVASKRSTSDLLGTKSRHGTSQAIALTAIEIAILAERRTTIDGDYVFTGRGPRGHLVEPTKTWKTLLARAGIKDCTLHDLRRNLRSMMASLARPRRIATLS